MTSTSRTTCTTHEGRRQTVADIKVTLVGFVPAAVLRKELGCAELARHRTSTVKPFSLSPLLDLTELVIGANLPSGSFHRGNEIRALFFFAHLAFCGVLGFDFGDTSFHPMFSHELPSMHIGIGGLSGNPPIRLGK